MDEKFRLRVFLGGCLMSHIEEGMVRTDSTHDTFEQALSGSSSQVKEVAGQLRAMIIDVYPEVVEVP
jgi:hypothetical protein